MKLWMKSSSGLLLGVIWSGNPGPIIATVVSSGGLHDRPRHVFFHQTGMYQGYPVYEEQQ